MERGRDPPMTARERGRKLREMRAEKHLTQTDVGNRLGVGKTTVCNYELGNRTPDVATLARLSYIYDARIEDLI